VHCCMRVTIRNVPAIIIIIQILIFVVGKIDKLWKNDIILDRIIES
jgi:hypothetical protein